MNVKIFNRMNTRLCIELLTLEKGKAYGFQEYIFNILNYLYNNRALIKYDRILIICKDVSVSMFDTYKDKFDIIGFSFTNYLQRFTLQSILPLKLGLRKTDLLLCPQNYSGFIKRCPQILVIHDLLFKRKEYLKNKTMRIQRQIFMPISIRKADRIIAISNFTANDIIDYYPKSNRKISVIYNSLNYEKYGYPVIKYTYDYFLTVASNASHKNIITILKAYDVYCKSGGNKKLVIVGRLGQNTEAYQILQKLNTAVKDKVLLKADISNEELGSLYANAACYISASLFEGFGMPIAEAMYFNTPVLLSDIQIHREISLGMGDYFSGTDYMSLAKIMKHLNCDRRDYSSKIQNLFSLQNTAHKYLDIINAFAVGTNDF